MKALILCSGAGGSTEGIRDAGVTETLSIEWMSEAVDTARAAGHDVIQKDIRSLNPTHIAEHTLGVSGDTKLLLQVSPPCQGLSPAGKGKGREDLELLMNAVRALNGITGICNTWGEAVQTIPDLAAMIDAEASDERSPLTFEVLRWIFGTAPEYIMLEQVPTALPIWEEIADTLRSWGYSVWTGNVQAEQFGVPQTRKRAMLLASIVSTVTAPKPTHSKYYSRSPQKLDEGVEKWVSMAEALGWPEGRMVSNYGTGGDASKRGVRTTDQPVRSVDTPAPTITASMDNGNFRWHTPQPAIEGETEADLAWAYDRPAPTIVGSFAPDVVARPKYRGPGDGPRQKTPGSVRVTVEEAGVLQSFPADYPWQGTKGKRFLQVGNAVPPLLQRRLTEHLLYGVTEREEIAC